MVFDEDAYEEFTKSEVKDYSLYIDRASGDIHRWKMENADHFYITLQFTRTIRENMDLKDDDAFWTNAFYMMARGELSIQQVIALRNNKAGQAVNEAKGSTWYSHRYRAISTAVRHTRNGKVSSEEYTHKVVKKKSRKSSNKEAPANQTLLRTDTCGVQNPELTVLLWPIDFSTFRPSYIYLRL